MAKRETEAKAKTTPAEKPAEVRYDTPEALAAYDAATVAEGERLYQQVQDARAALSAAKERTKDLKQMYEAARIAHESHTPDRQKYRGQKPPSAHLADQFGSGAKNELWRLFPIGRWTHYGALPGDIKKLAEGKIKGTSKAHPIITVGDLHDFTQPWKSDPSRNYVYEDIVGLGDAGGERLREANKNFFAEWENNGLKEDFAREMGVNLDADSTTDGKGSGETPVPAGGDGDKPLTNADGTPKRKRGRPRKHPSPEDGDRSRDYNPPDAHDEPAGKTASA